MTTKILKFGGTSMGSVESLKAVASVIQTNLDSGVELVVVCSAMSQVTNQLIKIGHLAEESKSAQAEKLLRSVWQKHLQAAKALGVLPEFKMAAEDLFIDLENFTQGVSLIHEFSPRSEAYLVSFGERFSVRLLQAFLQKMEYQVQALDSVFIKTKGPNYLEAEVDWPKTKKATSAALKPLLSKGVIPLVTGFSGTSETGICTLLGRGGSDLSAAIVAVSLGVKTLEIWTDVDGFMTADPRQVKKAQVLDEIGYIEVSEICAFGAKVLHPKTIRPVIDAGGEVWVKNTFNPSAPGTKIVKRSPQCRSEVLSIACKSAAVISFDLFGVPLGKSKSQVLAELFGVINTFGICVDAVASSEALVSLGVEAKVLKNKAFLKALKQVAPFEILENRTMLTMVSPQCVQGSVGTMGKIFTTLGAAKVSIQMNSQNAAEVALVVIIKEEDENKALQAIHKNLIETT